MKTPLQYKNQISELDLVQIKTADLGPAEAKQQLANLAEIQARVKDIEVNLNLDIHALRSQFQGRIASFSVNPRRNVRIEESRHVEEERDNKLAPYEQVKTELQAIITELTEKQAALEKIQA